MTPAIAIVGMACRYPDAHSPQELWETVLAQRTAFRKLPPERLQLSDYFSADKTTADAIYSQSAALLRDYDFDRQQFRTDHRQRAGDLHHEQKSSGSAEVGRNLIFEPTQREAGQRA